jgi:SET domain
MGLVNLRKQQSTRSLEWLQEHGICADNLREGVSKIPQAGRGAFATRFLKRGAIVAPLPLIHMPSRERLEMFQPDFSVENVVNKTKAVGQQLLVNYCFGHRHSTMLLCPYGLLTGLINHARTPNVMLRWSDPKRSAHAPEWLNKTVEEFAEFKFSVLSMELVAIRDIEPDEEVVLDYGEEWEAAWNAHVASWSPVEGASSHELASELNEGNDTKILRTVFEQFEDPYPDAVHIRFDLAFSKGNWKEFWMEDWKNGTLLQRTMTWDSDVAQCDILSIRHDDDGNTFYNTIYWNDELEEHEKVQGVPREAFVFRENPYTADYLQQNVFRHDIRIPDEMFPDSWKNQLSQ